MKRITLMLVGVAVLACVAAAMAPSAQRDEAADSIAAGNLPSGYRDWRLISVAREEGQLDDIRAVLGNDAAINAYRDAREVQQATPSFPDGTIIARIAWAY